jgi:hypothetical protein
LVIKLALKPAQNIKALSLVWSYMTNWVGLFSDIVYQADVLKTVKYMPSAKPSEHCCALGDLCTVSLLREQAALTFECQRNSEINNFFVINIYCSNNF